MSTIKTYFSQKDNLQQVILKNLDAAQNSVSIAVAWFTDVVLFNKLLEIQTKGNIVFTCSIGLTGVGLDRAEWNAIKDYKEGETYEHTIEKSELYKGKVVTYYAPFDKCDRVEDYKVAWEYFAWVFKD